MESAVNDNDNNNIDEVKNVVFTNQLNQQQPRRRNKSRTRVERQMDSIRDLSANEREQILDKLIDDSVDDEVEAKAKAELVNPSDYIEGALQRIKNWGQRVGLSSGYYAIDNMTMGFAPGELTIVAGVTSSGKCEAKGTKILMADGTLKKIEDIEIGDYVQSEHGANKVVGKHNGFAKMYKIIPQHGEPFCVSQDHIMTCLRNSSKRTTINGKRVHQKIEYNLVDIKIEDLFNKHKRPNGTYHKYQLYRPEITTYTEKSLPIPPYILGLWLGDGHATSSMITNGDDEVLSAWTEYAKSIGCGITEHYEPSNCKSLRIVGQDGKFLKMLRGLGVLNNKHIPLDYLTGSWEQRMELLAGILDTDGYRIKRTNGNYEIAQKNKTLASQIAQLARGLGCGVTTATKLVKLATGVINEYQRLEIASTHEIPCRVARRKCSDVGKRRTDPRRTGFRIEQIEDGEYYGIMVDGDHRFMLWDNTLTHNTLLCCNIAANMVKKKHKVVFVTLEMTKEELLSRFWNILGYGYDEVGQKQMAETCQYLRFQQIDRMNWQTIPYLIEQAKSWGAECVFIDHLHYFAREMHDVANELGIITQEFKQAAIKNQLPIILISHTRKIEKGKSHADINDLRGSSYIAQDADIVLMVWQEQSEKTEGIYIGLDKNRNRLNYKIGTAIRHNKCGLVIMDLNDEGRKVADQNSVPSAKPKTAGFVSANPIPAPAPRQPAPTLPKKGEPDPWNKPLSQPELPPIEKEHLNGVIKF